MNFFEKRRPVYQAEKQSGVEENDPTDLIEVKEFLESELVRAEDMLETLSDPDARKEAAEAAGMEVDEDLERESHVNFISAEAQTAKQLRQLSREFAEGKYENVLSYLRDRVEARRKTAQDFALAGMRVSERSMRELDGFQRMVELLEAKMRKE